MAYNESGSLEAVTRELKGSLAGLGVEHELLIVDDGSVDGTGAIADRLSTDVAGVRVVHHDVNRGLGGVYRTGFSQARGDLVTFFPADGQFPATILESFLPRMANTDMVLGYLDAGRGLVGGILSGVERALYRALLGRMPRFQGVFMFRRCLLAQVPLRSEGRGWGVVMELILRIHRAGYRVESVPIAIRPRMSGRSKVQNWLTAWSNFRQLLELRARL